MQTNRGFFGFVFMLPFALALVLAADETQMSACTSNDGCKTEMDQEAAALATVMLQSRGSTTTPLTRGYATCNASKSAVIQEVLKGKKIPLTGEQTGNLPYSATKSNDLFATHEGLAGNLMYGSGQNAIAQDKRHCAKKANSFEKLDFDLAWVYLSCEINRLFSNPAVIAAFDRSLGGIMPMVHDANNPPIQYPNPWIGATQADFVEFFRGYFFFLPEPNGTNNGLYYILKSNYFARENQAAIDFLTRFKSQTPPATIATTEIFQWTYMWVTARGMWMDSHGSTEKVKDWVDFVNSEAKESNDPMDAYEGYVPDSPPGYGYDSFNQYFARIFKNYTKSRPISQPDDKMIVTAPGDVEINFIINKLRNNTQIPVKGDNFNIKDILNGSKHASRFVGGTALSNVLMPYAYHNFHAPVSGRLIEAVDIPGIFFGIPDGQFWFGSGNTGGGNTDFSVFGAFHRLVLIYDTGEYGLVAQIAVGLADVNSICPTVGSEVELVPPGSCSGDSCPLMAKGERVGFFLYGGSLNILLFEPGVYNSADVLMGNRIGSMSAKS